MNNNEEKNWWDEDFKPNINQKDWEEKLGELIELVFKLTEKTFDLILNEEENEKLVKDLIFNHMKKIHKFAYEISLKEDWMNAEFIKNMVENYYFSINSSAFLLKNLSSDYGSFADENSRNQIMLKKVKRTRFYQLKDLYVSKLVEEVSIQV